MKITTKRLENFGFTVEKTKNGYEISQYTPKGEDWCLYFDKLEDIIQYAEDFDEGEEFAMWVDAKRSGFRGVPGYKELWQDQLWKKEILCKVASLY